MRIFIAGATGVLGRRVVPELVVQGHEVVGLSRSDQNARWLQEVGARAARADLFDLPAVTEAVSGAEAVLHLATSIPTKARTSPKDWALNDRIRVEGTRNLLQAAQEAGSRLYLQQSVTFVYGDREGAWVDEEVELDRKVPSNIESAMRMEALVQAREGPWSIVRFGTFYSADSAHTQAILQGVRSGRLPILGDGRAYWNLIHVDDAAQAILQSLELPEASIRAILNVVDDQPVTAGELIKHLAGLLKAPRPRRVPAFVAKLALGSGVAETLLASVRVRNTRVKDRLGWTPRYPSYREGMAAIVEEWMRE